MTFGAPIVVRPSASVNVGVVGPKGASLLSGNGAPSSSTGTDDDLYFDRTNRIVYGPKVSGAWPTPGYSIKGDKGEPGPQILGGGGAPSTAIGVNGDYFLDTSTSTLYGPKTTGAWPTPGMSLLGGAGPATTLSIGTVTTLPSTSNATAEVTGVSPSQLLNLGIPAGSRIYSGSGAPANTTGANGDFYLDTSGAVLYGPKASGSWPSTGLSLTGPPGASGSGTGNVISSGSFTVGNALVASNTTGTSAVDGGRLGFVLVDNPSSPYTSVNRDEVWWNTTAGAVSQLLPASPTAGMRVRANRSGPNTVTVAANGNTIAGVASDLVINTDKRGVELIWSVANSTWYVVEIRHS